MRQTSVCLEQVLPRSNVSECAAELLPIWAKLFIFWPSMSQWPLPTSYGGAKTSACILRQRVKRNWRRLMPFIYTYYVYSIYCVYIYIYVYIATFLYFSVLHWFDAWLGGPQSIPYEMVQQQPLDAFRREGSCLLRVEPWLTQMSELGKVLKRIT